MIINGKEIGFRRSVSANCRLADIAPGHDIGRFFKEKILSINYAEAQRAAAQLIAAMNEGYELYQHFIDPAHVPDPVQPEALLSLDEATFNALYQEAINAYNNDGKTTVEVQPSKGKKTKQPGASN